MRIGPVTKVLYATKHHCTSIITTTTKKKKTITSNVMHPRDF